MNLEIAAHVVMEGSSNEVRELTRQIIDAVREVADGKPAHVAAEGCVRAAALVGLVCAKPGRGANVLRKGASILQALSDNPTIRGVTVQ